MKTANRRQRRLPPLERQQQLLNCALIAAARSGVGRLTHAEVARQAGVAVPTVFLYFPSRDALIRATVAEVKRYYLAQGAHWHRAQAVPREALRGHLYAFAESVATHVEYAQIWLEWSTAVRNENGIWDDFLVYQNRMVGMVAATIRRGQRQGSVSKRVTARDAARLFVSSAYAITQLRFMHSERRVIHRFLDHVVTLALHD